jgi:hypothetical protein
MVLGALATGCGGPTAQQVLQERLKQDNIQRHDVFPLAGRVTIDGQPPGSDSNVILVMLNDAKMPDLPVAKRPYTTCTPNGDFAFSTYLGGDGFEAGDYILTFAMLTENKKGLFGPDQLKNLYNDPDKNKANPDFHVDHKAPGRKDYAFDLKVKGKEAVERPGKFALTGLTDLQQKTGNR